MVQEVWCIGNEAHSEMGAEANELFRLRITLEVRVAIRVGSNGTVLDNLGRIDDLVLPTVILQETSDNNRVQYTVVTRDMVFWSRCCFGRVTKNAKEDGRKRKATTATLVDALRALITDGRSGQGKSGGSESMLGGGRGSH